MKKQVLLLIAMFACASFTFAQVLKINQMETNDAMERIFVKEIQRGDVIKMDTKGSFIEFDSDVINTSDMAKTVSLMLEVYEHYTEGIDISACWGECLAPWNFRFEPVVLPSEGAEVFRVDYSSNGISDSKALVKCTFLIDDVEDFIFYVNFGDADNSVKESIISKTKLYPNPATSIVNIDYLLNRNNTQIVIYNILGVSVYEQKLQNRESTAIIEVTGFAAGIYFYTIKIDGKAVETKKLVVCH